MTFGGAISKTASSCARRCNAEPCSSYYGFTILYKWTDKRYVVVLEKLSPGEPDFVTLAQPTMLLIEYFSFVAGCLNAWFGLSFMNLDIFNWSNPFKAERQQTLTGTMRRKRPKYFDEDEINRKISSKKFYTYKGFQVQVKRQNETKAQAYEVTVWHESCN